MVCLQRIVQSNLVRTGTYVFQTKDKIGTFSYFPTINLQMPAAGLWLLFPSLSQKQSLIFSLVIGFTRLQGGSFCLLDWCPWYAKLFHELFSTNFIILGYANLTGARSPIQSNNTSAWGMRWVSISGFRTIKWSWLKQKCLTPVKLYWIPLMSVFASSIWFLSLQITRKQTITSWQLLKC